jgi:hypothetical protein
MLEYASTFEHCARILAPITHSKALSHRRERAFRKALDLVKTYDQAMLLCSWAIKQMEKDKAYTLMVRLTPLDASQEHLKELIHEFGIPQKISWVAADAHRHLLALRSQLAPDDQYAHEFIKKLTIFDQSVPYGQLH